MTRKERLPNMCQRKVGERFIGKALLLNDLDEEEADGQTLKGEMT